MAANGARVHIFGDWDGTGVKKAQSDLGYFEKQATGVAGGLTKSFMGIGAAIGGAFALGSVIDFMQQAMQGAIEDEKSVVALAKAMDNLGLSSQKAIAEDFIKKMMLATGVADDQLRPAFQKLVTATGDVTKSQELLQLSLDVSAATGKDLASVSQAMAKASLGQVSALTRLGVPLDAGIVKQKDFAAAVEVLTEKFGGQAAAAADTYGGSLARVQVAADEAKETIGYALLNALDDLSERFGGTGGIIGAIDNAGESMANFITGVSLGANAIVDFFNRTAQAIADANLTEETNGLTEFFKNLVSYLPGTSIAAQYTTLAEEGAKANEVAKKLDNQMAALSGRYAGQVEALRPAAVATRELADAQEEAKQKAAELKDMFLKLTGALSASAAQDAFVQALRNIDNQTQKNIKTFDGYGKAASANKDLLRGLFSDAASQAEEWQKQTGASVEKTQAYFDGLAGVIIKKFVNAGFKKKDVLKFLGDEGIWAPPITQAVNAAGATAKAVAWANGKNIGTALTDGVSIGIMDGTPKVVHQSGLTIAAATRKANEAAGINSPSKVWAEMGGHLVDGLIVGMASKDSAVQQKARDTMQALSDKASDILTAWDDKLSRLKDRLAERKSELMDAAKSVSSAIMEGLDFSAANDMTTVGANGEQVGMSFIAGLQAQAEQVKNFALKVRELLTAGLSQAAIQQVLAAGTVAGTAIAQELIDGGATAISTTNDLVSTTQEAADEVGLLAGTSWYGAGVASAQKTYEGFRDNFGPGKPARVALENLMDRLANSLDRTVTVSVKTVYEAAGIKGARALGGPVTAGDAWLVGEKGPEVFVPSTNGNIIPNGGLPMSSGGGGMGGGTTVNIVVNAGIGTDGYAVGKVIVDSIKKYERVSGPVFAAA